MINYNSLTLLLISILVTPEQVLLWERGYKPSCTLACTF